MIDSESPIFEYLLSIYYPCDLNQSTYSWTPIYICRFLSVEGVLQWAVEKISLILKSYCISWHLKMVANNNK